ncbi:unnamed protein product [Ostreobium quekettii]|uniref:FAD-binding domain-containing protein n=1 Tax=Ostreobium quekettii TaxID=121088 RepID=A0A8S1IMK7_9CHLO|nr:unnamed protein product [Ostreobium quekettii]|eukprot:evm.model.scf_134.10 EVM.evm.TU.scf_134.10   scf_134:110360-111592(-)
MVSTWRAGWRVAVVGAGPGGISTAIAMKKAGYDVRVYEKTDEPRPLGGAVLLPVPVLAVLRSYGIDIGDIFGRKTVMRFCNSKGKLRAVLPFNKETEKAFGIEGWLYGTLRPIVFGKMLDAAKVLDPGMLFPSHALTFYEDRGEDVVLHFENGAEVVADLLIGADGIRSVTAAQAFGDLKPFHVGLRAFRAWCEDLPGLSGDVGVVHNARNVQASYYPIQLDGGKPGFAWWVIERSDPKEAPPVDPVAHVRALLSQFAHPMPVVLDHTDLDRMYRWEIYNRPPLQSWSSGRFVGVGDAVHPLSPYGGYGMGMAIEDGYFLARAFAGGDLTDRSVVDRACARYEGERVAGANQYMAFARKLGARLHDSPAPVALLRDFVLDNTWMMQRMLNRQYIALADRMSLALRELHVT